MTWKRKASQLASCSQSLPGGGRGGSTRLATTKAHPTPTWTRGSPLVAHVGNRGDVIGTSSSHEFVAKASIADEGSR